MSAFDDDEVYLQSRREAIYILLIWFVSMVWSVGYCYWKGYSDHRPQDESITAYLPDMSGLDRSKETLTTPFGWGIPDWCFWGVAVPWAVCAVIGTWFSLVYMPDNPEEEEDFEETNAGVAS
jgi:hypothetical protein